MKKGQPPIVRKIHGQPANIQMNTVKKINNLMSSGAVSVTTPQPRILKQKLGTNTSITAVQSPARTVSKCYICDESTPNTSQRVTEASTSSSNTKLPNKIGRVVGDSFMVIISVDDVICTRCMTLFNHMDRLESDLEKVKTNILNNIYTKYCIEDEGRLGQPAPKLQKLNSGGVVQIGGNRVVQKIKNDDDDQERKPGIQPRIVTSVSNQKQIVATQLQQPQKKVTRKLYRCMLCEFQTPDLSKFQPHFAVCKQTNGHDCKICKKVFNSATALRNHSIEKHGQEQSELLSSNDEVTMHACHMCAFKTTSKQTMEDHLRVHKRVKPFKCRICAMRFETREEASTHARSEHPPPKNIFKCAQCNATYSQREQLQKHFEVHRNNQTHTVQTVQQQQSPQTFLSSTQKLLQDTIEEALRDSADPLDTKDIKFFSCNICSVTFIQENYYNQHMEAHKREEEDEKLDKQSQITIVSSAPTTTTTHNLIRSSARGTKSQAAGSNQQISDADLESIFEKMHSDKAEIEGANNANGAGGTNNSNENLVITTQANSGGQLTFNISIAPEDNDKQNSETDNSQDATENEETGNSQNAGIDMPMLEAEDGDPNDEHKSGPVSMPSLDDDSESQAQPSNTDAVPMDLEEMQNSDGQIKLILNENGEILQLDNPILTTDAEGNQILVGSDNEQIQQLLQNMRVIHTGQGLEGETLQMIGDNNPMIIVQQDGSEAQLIDASMINADGQIIIHPEGDGEEVPVSIAFTTTNSLTSDEHSQDEDKVTDTNGGTEHQTKTDGDTESQTDSVKAEDTSSQESINLPVLENSSADIPVSKECKIDDATVRSSETNSPQSFLI